MNTTQKIANTGSVAMCELASRGRVPGQIVLVLQGGGALGAYQAGVYQALHEGGIEPDWVVGTSIGAINASLIAGNEPENRLPRLEEFWRRMADTSPWDPWSIWPQASSITLLPAHFDRWPSQLFRTKSACSVRTCIFHWARTMRVTTRPTPWRRRCSILSIFPLVNRCRPRLTVGAAHVGTSQMRYFDSRDMEIGVKHILASGALPPAFPAVRIDGELYWDGEILSNTPTEVVFDDNPRQSSLIFAVHMWNPIATGTGDDLAGPASPEGHPVFKPGCNSHLPPAADPSVASYDPAACRAPSRSGTQQRGCARARHSWLSDPYACRPPAGTAARQ